MRVAMALIGIAVAGVARTAWTQEGATPTGTSTETLNLARSDFRRADAGLVREVRLALVCYGGSSLAIYIHGNTKEIFRLVQASKALQQDAIANGGAMQNAVAARARPEPGPGPAFQKLTGSARQWYLRLLRMWIDDPQTVRTRVVVDVIAGTSAGGINGVILAKALAHDLPIDKLTELWLNKASLAKLTNNYFGLLRIFAGRAPVDGDALVSWLFDALNGMDKNYDLEHGHRPSLLPGGDRLDLFVTATDRYGYPQNLVVGDPASAVEKRYSHVLHFTYPGVDNGCDPESAKSDHFCPQWTPALAFAARASSSIPGVFPPLNLKDTTSLLAKVAVAGPPPAGTVTPTPDDKVVHSLFRNYELQEQDEKGTFAVNTYFVDGGVLDNHPFGPAIESILSRPQDQEVRRYLVYLQPDPGTPPTGQTKKVENPGLFKTIWAGLATIPSGQPILNDLNHIAEHNAELDRIREIVETENRAARNMDQAARQEGGAAGSCDHLSELPIAQRLGCSVGICPGKLSEAAHRASQSDLAVVRHAIENAAETGFVDRKLVEQHLDSEARKDFQQCFQAQGDEKRRIVAPEGLDTPGRSYINLRVHSVLQQFITVLAGPGACDYPEESAHRALLAKIIEGWAEGQGLIENKKDRRAQPPPAEDPAAQRAVLAKQRQFLADFDIGYQRRQLRFVIDWINEEYKKAPGPERRQFLDALKTAAADRVENLTGVVQGATPDLQKQLGSLGSLFCHLHPWPLQGDRTVSLDEQADAFLAKPENQRDLSAARNQLGGMINGLQEKERAALFKKFEELKTLPPIPLLADAERQGILQEVLVRYLAFPFWDRQIYPYVAFSDVGEFREIGVYRLSPDDATLLGSLPATKKLSGSKVAHFGAFLTREGRESDYLWGRLDAVDRLLSLLAKDPDAAKAPEDGKKPEGAKDLFNAILAEERAVQPKPLIRAKILEDREADIKRYFP
jgi:patatin-related protein